LEEYYRFAGEEQNCAIEQTRERTQAKETEIRHLYMNVNYYLNLLRRKQVNVIWMIKLGHYIAEE